MPRSPSRDLSDRFEGNRGYFHRAAPIARAKYTVSVLALVLAVGWVVADLAFPAQAVLAHTHGPVANPHAHWENDCAACHKPHGPSEIGLRSVFQARDRWHDLTCEKCHAGPAHVATLADADHKDHDRCSNCHHEHAGRLNSLVRITDDHCTRCHAELAAHHVAGKPQRHTPVTSFTRDHPEFRALGSQPERALKFSHAVHMTPGLLSVPAGREAMTVSRLKQLSGGEADEIVERFGLKARRDDHVVALECHSCHQLDAGAGTGGHRAARALLARTGEPGRAVLPTRAGGADFLPVNFEVHCRACHPLQAPAGVRPPAIVPGFAVTHRQPAAKVRAELQVGYLRGLLAADHPALAAPARPGGALDPRHAVAAQTLRAVTDRLARDAEDLLLSASTGCAKCHDVEEGEVKPLPDHTVWLTMARFNHARHKPLACSTCHPGTSAAFVEQGKALVEKEPLQILGIDSCRACHSPSGTRVKLPDGGVVAGGGARHGCVDCHRYHNADHGLQGRGARVLWPDRPLDIAEFLRGGRK